MRYREATLNDIPQLQKIRHSVKENVLSNPALVTDEDCAKHLTRYGKGWVCEADKKLVGFAIADLQHNNIWALFVLPNYEGKSIGKTLHNTMLNWYFSQTDTTVWLSTAANTRAEQFYGKQGWQPAGLYNANEVKFEMTAAKWEKKGLHFHRNKSNKFRNLFSYLFLFSLQALLLKHNQLHAGEKNIPAIRAGKCAH